MIPTTEEAALNSVQTPTRTVLALIVMWLGVAFPLVYLGAYFGYKKAAIEPPVKVRGFFVCVFVFFFIIS
jgi:hypothetical protein